MWTSIRPSCTSAPMTTVGSRPRPPPEASHYHTGPQSASDSSRLGSRIADPIFPTYAQPRGSDNASAMLMKRLRTVITDKKLTMHSLRHRMKDKLRNTGCPEAISMAILGHSTNTVAANYGSGYALEVMREHLEKTWT